MQETKECSCSKNLLSFVSYNTSLFDLFYELDNHDVAPPIIGSLISYHSVW